MKIRTASRRRTMRQIARAGAVGTAAALIIGLAGPATAAEDPSVEEVVADALASAPGHVAAPQPGLQTDVEPDTMAASVTLIEGVEITITPHDADNSVSLERPDGVQVLTVLDEGNTASFDLDLPDGLDLIPIGEGLSVQADGPAGPVELAVIESPWAVDAEGHRLDTSYSLQGGTLVQSVDTEGAAYPITLDPYVVTKWYGAQIRFSRSETKIMAAGAGGVTYVSRWLPPPYNGIVSAAAGAVALWSGWALAANKCIAINMTYIGGKTPWYWSC